MPTIDRLGEHPELDVITTSGYNKTRHDSVFVRREYRVTKLDHDEEMMTQIRTIPLIQR